MCMMEAGGGSELVSLLLLLYVFSLYFFLNTFAKDI